MVNTALSTHSVNQSSIAPERPHSFHQDLKDTQVELQLRENQLRNINLYIPGVIYQYASNLKTAGSRFTYISPRSIDLFEYSAEAVVADENLIWAMINPEDLGRIVRSVSESSRDNTAWRGEFRILTPSGQLKWIQGQSEPDTAIVDYSLHNGIFFDITDRKNAEAEIQALADRQTLLNQISNQIRSSLDIDSIINNALNAIRPFLDVDICCFAWSSIEIEDGYWDVIQESKRDDLPSVIGQYPIDLVGHIYSLLSETSLLRVDDVSPCLDLTHRKFLESIHCQSELLIPITTQSQRIGVLICTNYLSQHRWTDREVDFLQSVCAQLAIAISQADLYRQSQAKSKQLKETLKQLKLSQSQVIQSEKMSSLGQLVAGIAHEINNPANFIHGNVTHTRNYTQDLLDLIKLYQDAYPTPTSAIVRHIEDIDLDFLQEDLPKTLNSMQIGTERIREIVKSLRNFSRLDEIGSKAVDIHEGIDSTLLILQNRLIKENTQKTIVIEKHYGELPLIECFAGQLNQVFMNVIANAIDALEEDRTEQSGQITITTKLMNDRHVSIAIHDNGPGIPSAIHSKIFDPFFTTKPVGKGTGMGLSISYQIITEMHGGALILKSTPEAGTTFIVTIPIQLSTNS